jgi:hypothetical protein
MKRMKQIISGICILAFALLGAYCSWQAIQIHRQLNGQPDIDDSVRNWSTGATACLVACGVIGVLGKKKQEMIDKGDGADGQPPFKWWRTAVGMTVILAVCFLLILIVIFIFFDRGAPKPELAPRLAPLEAPKLAPLVPAPSSRP